LSRLRPLRHPAFRRLCGAYAISRIGDVLAIVALAIVVYDRTKSTYATAALFAALEFLPALAGPALAARLDRVPVRRTLPLLYTLEATLFVALAVMSHSFSLAPFLVLVAIDGAVGVVSRALCRGSVAAVLEPTGELREGNALINLAVAPSMAIGGIVGGVVVVSLGADIALLANAATFAFGAVLIVTARGLPHYEGEGGEPIEHWRRRLAATLRYVRTRRLLFTLLAAEAVALLFFAASEPIEVAYTVDALDTGAGGYGALIAAWGAGVVVGSVVYTAVGTTRLAVTTIASTALQAVAYIGLAAAPGIEVACVVAVVGGAANGAQLPAVATAIQEAVALDQQVRVMSVYEAVMTASPGVGYLLGGALAAGAGSRAVFLVGGVGVLAVLAVALAVRPWRPDPSPARGVPAPERA
jgi:MFS family permease